MGSARRFVIGVISDTHGPLPRAAADALAGVDHIVCAGDVLSPEVLPALRRIAPVTAVRGNMDRRDSVGDLPDTAVASVGGVQLYVIHDRYRLDLDPTTAGFAAVIHGHTHRPEVDWIGDVLYLNPGSAGAPRTHTGPTIAKIVIEDGRARAEIVALEGTP